MKVFSLLGFTNYEGSELLGVFASQEQMMEYVEQQREQLRQKQSSHYSRALELVMNLNFDSLGYVESELGQAVDVDGQVEFL